MSASLPFASSKPKDERSSCASKRFASREYCDATLSEDETAALRELKGKLSSIPHEEKSALVHVQRVQPDLVDDKHIWRFLRVEDFNVDLALKRLVTYWEERLKVFGPDKYALPMTLNGAMKENIDVLRMGFLHLFPVLDEAGRAVIYHDSSPYKTLTEPPAAEHRIRAFWYLLHVALEMPGVARNGYVNLINPNDLTLNNFDPKWGKAIFRSDRALPIRWTVTHGLCINSNPVLLMVTAAAKAWMSQKQRDSFILHNGSASMILESLAKYHLPAHCVPTGLGGTLQLSIDEFIQKNWRIEDGVKTETQRQTENAHSTTEGLENPSHSLGNMVSEKRMPGPELADSTKPTSTLSKSASDKTIRTKEQKNTPRQMENKNSGGQKRKSDGPSHFPAKMNAMAKYHPGRYGDPRMNLAVEARLEDPNLSLLDALIAGGFVFPGIDEPGVKVGKVQDTDGVTLYQRRNQLLRRLRMMKGKAS